MILDECTYAIHPLRVQEYLDIYVAEGMAPQISHLEYLVGWFTTDAGVVNEVVHIWRYADIGDSERRRAIDADPLWQHLVREHQGLYSPCAVAPHAVLRFVQCGGWVVDKFNGKTADSLKMLPLKAACQTTGRAGKTG